MPFVDKLFPDVIQIKSRVRTQEKEAKKHATGYTCILKKDMVEFFKV